MTSGAGLVTEDGLRAFGWRRHPYGLRLNQRMIQMPAYQPFDDGEDFLQEEHLHEHSDHHGVA